jgi:hypothetical protein
MLRAQLLRGTMDLSRAKCSGCGQPMAISRVGCGACGVAMEGDFDIAPLALLSEQDQVFVHAFLRHHGSIKKMESLFGVSYPTVKNRLRAITAELDQSYQATSSRTQVLDRLARGEITVDEALEKLG